MFSYSNDQDIKKKLIYYPSFHIITPKTDIFEKATLSDSGIRQKKTIVF